MFNIVGCCQSTSTHAAVEVYILIRYDDIRVSPVFLRSEVSLVDVISVTHTRTLIQTEVKVKY